MTQSTYYEGNILEPDWNHLENYVISDPVYGDEEQLLKINWGWDGNGDDGVYVVSGNWGLYSPTDMITIN